MSGRGIPLAATFVVAVLGALVWVVTAGAASPAELVFESGGRVMSMDADGRNRINLTPSKDVSGSSFLDPPPSKPVISADGEHLAYNEGFYKRGWSYSRIIVADRDGTHRKVVLNSRRLPRKSAIIDLGWTPSGRLLAVEYTQGDRAHRFNLTRITSMKRDGSDRKVELRRIYRGVRDSFIVDASMSPDGRRILFGSETGGPIPRLEILNRASGKVRMLRNRAANGSWSPDGKRILFESDKTGIRESCFRGRCFGDSKIFIARSDGKGARRLTKGSAPGNETGADWSPDGSRIAFASDRNSPSMSEGDGREIYTVKPDGSCLTWLTNGTPASFSPSWGPEADRDTSPAECGQSDRAPLVDLVPDAHPLVNGEQIEWPRLWFGPVFGNRAQSMDPSDGRELEYADCIRFRPGDCVGPDWQISSDDVCLNWVGQLADFGGLGRIVKRRGALVFLPDLRRSASEALVVTGGQVVMLTPWPNRGRKVAAVTPYLKAVDALRPVDAPDATADLDPPVIDRKNVIRAKRYATAVKRIGSVRKAARQLKAKPAAVRSWLRINKALKKFGPVATNSCQGWFGVDH